MNAAKLIPAICLLWCTAVSSARAQEVAPLLHKGQCLSCHATDRRLVGPSYREVAQKYKGDAGAADRLAEKILKGGAGVWGPVPMPPAAGLSTAEAKTLARWVMAGAPGT